MDYIRFSSSFTQRRRNSTLLAPTKLNICMQGFFDMPNSILILPRPQVKQNEQLLTIFIFVIFDFWYFCHFCVLGVFWPLLVLSHAEHTQYSYMCRSMISGILIFLCFPDRVTADWENHNIISLQYLACLCIFDLYFANKRLYFYYIHHLQTSTFGLIIQVNK